MTNETKYIDLHTHSYFSDGSMSPEELVRHAKESGLSAIALTDHDTISGVERAKKEGEKIGVTVVTGIEFSAVSTGETHILGYDFDITNKELLVAIENVQESRRQNNKRTEEALQKLGFDITLEDVKKYALEGLMGRAHFARAMTDKGYTSSVKEAFDLYLAKGKPGYNSIRLLTDAEAIRLIKNAGGKAFLAHLHLTGKKGEELFQFVRHLKENGLDGIEGYYTEYTEQMQSEYIELAKRLDLKISGGSDFHGKGKPHISIGKGYGNLKIPYSLLENILN